MKHLYFRPIAALGNKNALELITKELKAMKLLIYGEGDGK